MLQAYQSTIVSRHHPFSQQTSSRFFSHIKTLPHKTPRAPPLATTPPASRCTDSSPRHTSAHSHTPRLACYCFCGAVSPTHSQVELPGRDRLNIQVQRVLQQATRCFPVQVYRPVKLQLRNYL